MGDVRARCDGRLPASRNGSGRLLIDGRLDIAEIPFRHVANRCARPPSMFSPIAYAACTSSRPGVFGRQHLRAPHLRPVCYRARPPVLCRSHSTYGRSTSTSFRYACLEGVQRLLARTWLLRQPLGCVPRASRPSALSFTHGQHGKPALAAKVVASGCGFSVSHAARLGPCRDGPTVARSVSTSSASCRPAHPYGSRTPSSRRVRPRSCAGSRRRAEPVPSSRTGLGRRRI